MIRFACAQCGKIHRVPDHFAGRRGRCGRCGNAFAAPIFVPATGITVGKTGRRRWPFAVLLVSIGIAVGVVATQFAGEFTKQRDMARGQAIAFMPVPQGNIPAPAPAKAPQPIQAPPQRAPKVANRAKAIPKGRLQPGKLLTAQQTTLDYLVKFANDPSSVEVLEWWNPVKADCSAAMIQYDEAVYFVVRSRNEFGALVTAPNIAYLDKGKVALIATNSSDQITWKMELGHLYGVKLQRDPIGDALRDFVK